MDLSLVGKPVSPGTSQPMSLDRADFSTEPAWSQDSDLTSGVSESLQRGAVAEELRGCILDPEGQKEHGC